MTPLLLLPLLAPIKSLPDQTAPDQTVPDQASLAILAETRLMRIAGMPAIELPPGVSMPEGVPMPGKPTRHLNVQLWAPTIAPKDATAVLAPPAGLGLGKELKLELSRPSASVGGSGGEAGFGEMKGDFTIKIYWGSSEAVREGQPKIVRWSGLTPEQKAQMRRMSDAGEYGGAKPEWTTGTWPNAKSTGAIKNGAALTGTYALNTSFTGNVALDVPAGIDFLPAIQLASPSLDDKPDLGGALPLRWAALPTALGQFASAFGMEGKSTMIVWMSSETYQEGMTGAPGFLEMAQVRDYVKAGTFLAPERTSATIPAGIFKNASMAMLNMAAWGPGAALAKGQPLPRLQTKSSLTVMLGGKDM